MELRQLECFLAVLDEGGFTRAATRLHTVQSGVSATIKTLEAEVGHPLFVRSPRGVSLTAEGAAIVGHARSVVRSFDALKDAAAELSGELRGSLALGILAAPDALGLADLVGRFMSEFPQVKLTVRSHPEGSAGLLADLVAERLDLSLIVLPVEVPAGIELIGLTAGPVRLTVPAGHPLTERSPVRAADLAGYPFVDFPDGFSTRIAVDAEFRRVGISRDTRVEGPSVDHVAAYIKAGAGIGFLPVLPILPGDAPEGLAALEVVDLAPQWTAALASKRSRHRSAAFQLLNQRIIARAATVRTAAGFPDPTSR